MDQKTQELVGDLVRGVDRLVQVTYEATISRHAQTEAQARGLALLVYTQDMGSAPEHETGWARAQVLANFILTGDRENGTQADPMGEPAAQAERPKPTKTGLA